MVDSIFRKNAGGKNIDRSVFSAFRYTISHSFNFVPFIASHCNFFFFSLSFGCILAVYCFPNIDTIPGRQCMASCFFLLKQFEDVLIYLNSIKVRIRSKANLL